MAEKSSVGPAVFEQVLASPAVKAALLAEAKRRLTRAQYAAYKAGRIRFGDNLRIVTGVRPGAKAAGGLRRPYARIISMTSAEEQAADNRTAKESRTQILRRAAR